MTGRPISYQVRNLIIKDCKRGVSQRKIAQKYEISKNAIQKFYKKFLDTGTVVDRSERGRTRSTTWRDDANIIRMVKKDPKATVRNIRESLRLTISDRTVRRRLREADLHSRFARKRPLINNKNKKKAIRICIKVCKSTRGVLETSSVDGVSLSFLDASNDFVCGGKLTRSLKIVTSKRR